MSSSPTFKDKDEDLEAQVPLNPQPASPTVRTEQEVSGTTKLLYLAVYFLCNISLTIYNKLILGKVSSEPPS